MISRALFLCAFLAANLAFALGPHEILLLVNEASEDSVAIAARYVALRHVPESNIVRLRLPASVIESPASISPGDFERMIWVPALRKMRERGVSDHVLAWVYSAGFPVWIKTSPPMSIHGLTFTRNKVATHKELRHGTYVSPLFAGPSSPGGARHFPQSFDTYHAWLGEDMPMPSMSLGHTGQRGNTRQEVLRCLQAGVDADATFPKGTVYFAVSGNVRSKARKWQFPETRRELGALDVRAEIVSELPGGQQDVIGLMAGKARVSPEKLGFLPGAMGEHLTSAAASFRSADQTKTSAWIAAGATASAGTVTEPYAIWTKFPSARFFVHYVSGSCMMESFYQSIRCPLQLYLVGEPLAAPWAPAAEVRLEGLYGEEVSGVVTVKASVEAAPGDNYARFVYLLDGRIVGRDPALVLDTTRLAEGPHVLRCVAYSTGLVRHQAFVEKKIVVNDQ